MGNIFVRGYAQESYERLILQKHTIFFDGLWELDGRYYILIGEPSMNLTDAEFTASVDWFDESCRIICTPVELVKSLPPNAISVPARTSIQLSQHHGIPFTAPEFNKLLKTLLPKSFPRFAVRADHGAINLEVESEISPEQKNEVELALANLGLNTEAEIVVNCVAWPNPQVKAHDNLDAKRSPPSAIRLAIEEDEDFWVYSRLSLFAEGSTDRNQYLKSKPPIEDSSCFINNISFAPNNIRGFLTLYKVIWIALPLLAHVDTTLRGLNISESELLNLAAIGRVAFVVPGRLQMYPTGLLAKILEAAPNSVIFSKRLAAAAIAESRRRNPLLFPNLNNVERRSVLDLLTNIGDKKSNALSSVFIEHFSQVWPSLEYSFSDLGAIGMMRNGLGRVAEGIAKEHHGIELGPFIYETMASVEWAAALGAVYSPIKTSNFDEGPLAEFSASIMTGVNQKSTIAPVFDMNLLMTGLLCLDNDAPIAEINETFKGTDLISLTKVFYEHANSSESLSNYINELNKKIKTFEKNQNKLQKMDLLGLVSAASAIAGTFNSSFATTSAAYIPVSVWILQKIFMQSESLAHGPILDWIRAKRFNTTSDTVLISRLRQKLI